MSENVSQTTRRYNADDPIVIAVITSNPTTQALFDEALVTIFCVIRSILRRAPDVSEEHIASIFKFEE
jgi:hypothetical protein